MVHDALDALACLDADVAIKANDLDDMTQLRRRRGGRRK